MILIASFPPADVNIILSIVIRYIDILDGIKLKKQKVDVLKYMFSLKIVDFKYTSYIGVFGDFF